MAARVGEGEGADTTGLQFVQNNATTYVLMRATLQNSDNRPLVRAWRVDLQAKAYGLPWRMLGADAPVILGEPPIQPKPL
jgi:methionine-rich copper-binding protein CopC